MSAPQPPVSSELSPEPAPEDETAPEVRFEELLLRLPDGLTPQEVGLAFDQVLGGGVSDVQAAAFLYGLRVRGETTTDVQAIADALAQLTTSEVRVDVVHRGVGAITESDILLAKASGAIVLGFHVRPDSNARAAAEREQVDVRTYRIIYEAVEREVGLPPAALLFTDDREENVAAAAARGWATHLFRGPEGLARRLVAEGLLSEDEAA